MNKDDFKFKESNRWGTIQHLHIEADTRETIVSAVNIALIENKIVTHYKTEVLNDKILPHDNYNENHAGAVRLTLLWSKNSDSDVELPFELDTVDSITDFIVSWLNKKARWPTESPDTDGSVEPGFKINTSWIPFTTFLQITPIWIVYGK